METPQEFTARTRKLQAQAEALRLRHGDDLIELNRWMGIAKTSRMTWVEGLAFAVEQMKTRS